VHLTLEIVHKKRVALLTKYTEYVIKFTCSCFNRK